jgi:hypothetical protein
MLEFLRRSLKPECEKCRSTQNAALAYFVNLPVTLCPKCCREAYHFLMERCPEELKEFSKYASKFQAVRYGRPLTTGESIDGVVENYYAIEIIMHSYFYEWFCGNSPDVVEGIIEDVKSWLNDDY